MILRSALLLLFAAAATATSAQMPPVYAPVPAQTCRPRAGLGNIFAKLKAGKPVRIAYFGGSITAQEGWRVKTLKWFRDTYPQAKIEEINATIGGTGSDLGVYRFQQDVLAHKPDLVFVEFAVNDGGTEPAAIWRNMEGIVRQAWKSDPNIDLCYVYTTTTAFTNDYDKGMCARAASSDEMLADHYGIPSICLGLKISELAKAGKLIYTPAKDAAGKEQPTPDGVILFSHDGVHPDDAGHVVYTQVITAALTQMAAGARPRAHRLPKPFVADNAEAAKMVAIQPSMLTGSWKKLPADDGVARFFQNRMPEIWAGLTPGDKLTFRFKGTAANLYDLMGPDGARLIVTVDGQTHTVDRFDVFSSYYRLAMVGLAGGLPNTEHTVTVEVSPQQPDRHSVTDKEKDKPGFNAKTYDGTGFRVGRILLIGDLVSATAASTAMASRAEHAPAQPALRLSNLTCEYRSNPLGIDVARPRLSWQMQSARRGARQASYRIRVASSPALLARGAADIWDSGRVRSDRSVLVDYAGKPLKSGQRCWWAVTVWDARGASAQSAPAWWEMGLLADADWRARWITAPAVNGETAPLFRRDFALAKAVRRARVYVAAAGYHELYVNGQRVGDRVLDPAFTRYDLRLLYVTHDVTSLVRRGKNAIGLMLGNGFYNSLPNDAWYFERAPWRDRPRGMARLEVEFADGSRSSVVTDANWSAAAGPVVFNAIRMGESYDARKELPGWAMPGYSGEGWAPAEVCDGPKGTLHAQNGPPCRVTQTLKATAVHEAKPGVYVVDMGQNLAGWVRMTVSGPAGTEITLKYSENLTAYGDIDQRNIAEHVHNPRFQTDVYTLKGVGTEVWEPRFVYHGFRYVQVTGFPGTPTPANFEARVVQTDFPSAGSFACSNELLNGIQRCTRWSYISNFVGIPTDCPHREKNGWMGDAHLAAEQGLMNYASAPAYTKWLDDMDDAQRPSGEMPGIVPTTGWGFDWGNGPAWDSALVLIPWYLYLYEGDARILERHYPQMSRYVDYVTGKSKNGLPEFGLGDWCPPTPGAAPESPTAVTDTGYYYADAVILARVAALLGRSEDAARFSTLAGNVKAAFNAKFVNAATGRVADGGQTSQACALYQGLAADSARPAVEARLLEAVQEHGGHLWCGILGTKYLLHALTDTGHPDVAYDVSAKRDFPSWGNWLEKGATTLWENWDGAASRNHIMFGDVSAWFYSGLAGIRPDPARPGFKHVIIRPNPVGDLTWVRAEHEGPYGTIRSAWRKENGRLTLEVTVPPNSEATVYVPAAEGAKVEADGATRVGTEPGRAVFRAASGTWRFAVR